jgi:nucleotide-binding universal stress UspA family protein
MAKNIKIVVATNFSKKSEMALDFALEYSQKFPSSIYLFHAFEEKRTDFRELDRLNVEYMERMKQSVIQAVNRMNARAGQHSVEDVFRRISHGRAADEIENIVAGIQADMLVMGTASAKQFRDFLMRAPCTIVMVREKEHLED